MEVSPDAVIPEKIQEQYTCHICYKFCSVKPVTLYHNRRIKCGRCARADNDGGTISLFNKIMENRYFFCINRFAGCEKLLKHTDVLEHEKNCNIVGAFCPTCKTLVPLFKIQKHFNRMHGDCVVESPTIVVNVGSEDNANYYFYKQENRVFFVVYYIDAKAKMLYFTALCLGNKSKNNHLIQNISVSTNDNSFSYKSSSMNCPTYESTENIFQGFSISIPHNTRSLNINFVIIFNAPNIRSNKTGHEYATLTYDRIFQVTSQNSGNTQPTNVNDRTNYSTNLATNSVTIKSIDKTSVPRSSVTSQPSLLDYNPMVYANSAGLASHLRSHDRPQQNLSRIELPLLRVSHERRNETASNTEPQRLTCSQCGMVCTNGDTLASHLISHIGDRSMLNVSGDTPSTPFASFERSSPSVTSWGLGTYACDICGRVCQSGAGLASHKRAHGRRGETVTQPKPNHLTCNQCGLICGSECEMRSQQKKSPFLDVSKVFGSTTDLQSKSLTTFDLSSPSFPICGSGAYSCDICGRVCQSGAGLASHKRAHERRGERVTQLKPIPLTCIKCGTICGSACDLRRSQQKESLFLDFPKVSVSSGHMQSVSFNSTNFWQPSSSSFGSGGLTCGICGRVCQSGAGLASHMRAHSRKGF